MGYHIHFIIEQRNEVYPMSQSRHKHRREQQKKHKYHHGHDRAPTTYPQVSPTPNTSLDLKNEPALKEKLETVKESREESSSDSNKFFHQNTLRTQGAIQTTNVTVNLNNDAKPDCWSSCMAGFSKCFGK